MRFDRKLAQFLSLGVAELRDMRRELRADIATLSTVERQISAHVEEVGKGTAIAGLPPGTLTAQRAPFFKQSSTNSECVSPDKKHELGLDTALFHDAKTAEVTTRQVGNIGQRYTAPFGLRVEAFAFTGSYLSLTFDLPFANALTKDHILSVRTHLAAETPMEVNIRLNIGKGAHVESMVRPVACDNPNETAEFDLYFSETTLDGSQKIWVDVIFDDIAFNQVT
ncbi:MAG: DUF6478 family protein, partial [Pseudomonadota bacterium]